MDKKSSLPEEKANCLSESCVFAVRNRIDALVFSRIYRHDLSAYCLRPANTIDLRILQIVVAPIPGEVVQLAGRYIYGTANGS